MLTGLTGVKFIFGDKSGTATGSKDSMHLWECGFPEHGIIWLLLYRDVPRGIYNLTGMISSVHKSSPYVVVAGAVANISVCGVTNAGIFNAAVPNILSYPWYKTQDRGRPVDAHFQHGAASVSSFFLILKAANTSNIVNNVPKSIVCN